MFMKWICFDFCNVNLACLWKKLLFYIKIKIVVYSVDSLWKYLMDWLALHIQMQNPECIFLSKDFVSKIQF